jgi:hypothetical protein
LRSPTGYGAFYRQVKFWHVGAFYVVLAGLSPGIGVHRPCPPTDVVLQKQANIKAGWHFLNARYKKAGQSGSQRLK